MCGGRVGSEARLAGGSRVPESGNHTAGLRAILVALNLEHGLAFPVTNAILYGLTFTLVLLFVYIPAHLALTETSRKLRDELRPLNAKVNIPL